MLVWMKHLQKHVRETSPTLNGNQSCQLESCEAVKHCIDLSKMLSVHCMNAEVNSCAEV